MINLAKVVLEELYDQNNVRSVVLGPIFFINVYVFILNHVEVMFGKGQ